MKLYIMIAGSFGGMNGVVIYIRNKLKYMEDMGWETILINTHNIQSDLPIYIDELKARDLLKDYKFECLKEFPSAFSRKNLNIYLSNMEKAIREKGEFEDCVIETGNLKTAMWGELLAKRLSGYHVHNSTTENHIIENSDIFEFLKFKLQRNEVGGIDEQSVAKMFEGYQKIDNSKDYYMPLFCDTVTEDYISKWDCNYDDTADYHVATIGRLDKKYISVMIEGCEEFANKFNKKIQIFIFGGAYGENVLASLNDIIEKCQFITCVITGFIYPIPKKLLKKMDISFASANAAHCPRDNGITTITMSGEDGQPIGVLDVTTKNLIYTDSNDILHSVCEWMELILIKNEYVYKIDPEKLPDTYSIEMQPHGEWLEQHLKEKCYFDTSKLVNSHKKSTVIRYFMYRLFGIKTIDAIRKNFFRKEI